jgi:hypothetical protein
MTMWEDPIVAEVRKAREQLFAEFDYDLEAYVEHLKRVQQEKQKLGVRYLESPLPSPINLSESDAR